MPQFRRNQIVAAGAANLRDRVSFEERISQADGYGNTKTIVWRRAIPAQPAEITPLLGGEDVMQSRLAGRQPAVIKVRYSSLTLEITTAMRVTDLRTGAVYAIKSVADVTGDRRFLDVLAESGTEA